MLSRLDFFKIRDRPFVFLVGGGGGGGGQGLIFFQQLKLDCFIDEVKVFFCVIQDKADLKTYLLMRW